MAAKPTSLAPTASATIAATLLSAQDRVTGGTVSHFILFVCGLWRAGGGAGGACLPASFSRRFVDYEKYDDACNCSVL